MKIIFKKGILTTNSIGLQSFMNFHSKNVQGENYAKKTELNKLKEKALLLRLTKKI